MATCLLVNGLILRESQLDKLYNRRNIYNIYSTHLEAMEKTSIFICVVLLGCITAMGLTRAMNQDAMPLVDDLELEKREQVSLESFLEQSKRDSGVHGYNGNYPKRVNGYNGNYPKRVNGYNGNYSKRVNGYNGSYPKRVNGYNGNYPKRVNGYNGNYPKRVNGYNGNYPKRVNGYNGNYPKRVNWPSVLLGEPSQELDK